MSNKLMLNRNEFQMKGTILIVALFIITLIEIVIAGLITYHRISIHHSKNYIDSYQALNLSFAGEEWARSRLLQSFQKNENMTNAELPKTKINDGYLIAELKDAQGKFNINNLTDSSLYFESFTSFMNNISGGQQSDLHSLIADIQKRATLYPSDRGVPFSTITELRPIPGMTKNLFSKLNEYINALPEPTLLNINSATKESLLTLSPQMTTSAADAIIKIRDNKHGFKTTAEFESIIPLDNIKGSSSLITIQSQYFIATITVHYNNIDLILHSLLKVNKKDNGLSVSVIKRSFGSL